MKAIHRTCALLAVALTTYSAEAGTQHDIERACEAALKPHSSTWVSKKADETMVFADDRRGQALCKVMVDATVGATPEPIIYLVTVTLPALKVLSIDELAGGKARRLQ